MKPFQVRAGDDAKRIAYEPKVSVKNVMTRKAAAGLLLVLIVVASPCAFALSAADPDGPVVTLTYLQATSSTLTSPPSGWAFSAQNGGSIVGASTPAPDSSGTNAIALEGTYPVPAAGAVGGDYIMADYSVASLNTEDLYIEFWAKVPGAKEGAKFLKIFGQHPSGTTPYADLTIPLDYTSTAPGSIMGAYFGDGTTTTNDSQNVIFLNGANPSFVGRSYGIAAVQTPQMSFWPASDWGTTWHHFRIHVKFNSGTTSDNEAANGEVYLEIDGKVYIDATGLYNRNPADPPIDRIEFFGWSQADSEALPDQSFQLWYDDIRINTGGFASQPLPDPPGDIQVK